MPLIGITSCRKLEDYRQSVLHVGGDVRVLEPTMKVDVPRKVNGPGLPQSTRRTSGDIFSATPMGGSKSRSKVRLIMAHYTT